MSLWKGLVNAESTTKAGAQASHALLPRWANDQDGWSRTIAGDVLKNRVQPSDLDIDRYLKLLLSEKKLSEETFQTVPKIEEKQLAGNPLEAVRLDSLKVGDGVNALKPGTQIDFAPGVTVIFGENGSGKSGFVRVLKRAAGVRTAEDILHNVRGDKRPTPSATFTVTVGTTPQTIQWNNDFGITPLNRVEHLRREGRAPSCRRRSHIRLHSWRADSFPACPGAVERVRTALDTAITASTPGPNVILASFDRSCSIYPIIETLGAATDLDEIKKYAVLPENIDVTIESLTIEVDALKSSNIQNELSVRATGLAVVKALKSAIETAKHLILRRCLSRSDAETGIAAERRGRQQGLRGGRNSRRSQPRNGASSYRPARNISRKTWPKHIQAPTTMRLLSATPDRRGRGIDQEVSRFFQQRNQSRSRPR